MELQQPLRKRRVVEAGFCQQEVEQRGELAACHQLSRLEPAPRHHVPQIVVEREAPDVVDEGQHVARVRIARRRLALQGCAAAVGTLVTRPEQRLEHATRCARGGHEARQAALQARLLVVAQTGLERAGIERPNPVAEAAGSIESDVVRRAIEQPHLPARLVDRDPSLLELSKVVTFEHRAPHPGGDRAAGMLLTNIGPLEKERFGAG